MPRPSLVIVLGALALAGCGSPSPKEQVTSTVDAFRDATAARDYGRICKEVLAPGLVRRLDDLGVPCEVALSRYLAGTRKPKLVVRKVTVTGDRARAEVRSEAQGQPPSDDVIVLVHVKPGWRIANLGGSGASTPKPGPSPGD